jgi:hypothetical protein
MLVLWLLVAMIGNGYIVASFAGSLKYCQYLLSRYPKLNCFVLESTYLCPLFDPRSYGGVAQQPHCREDEYKYHGLVLSGVPFCTSLTSTESLVSVSTHGSRSKRHCPPSRLCRTNSLGRTGDCSHCMSSSMRARPLPGRQASGYSQAGRGARWSYCRSRCICRRTWVLLNISLQFH